MRTALNHILFITLRARHVLVCTTLFCCVSISIQAQTASEYQVKAAFLFNFSKFIEWPPESFSNPGEAFVVGILGTDPFGKFLPEFISGEKVLDHQMVIKHFDNALQVEKCHILFVSESVKTAEVLHLLKAKNLLTISDRPNFVESGGMIEFYTENETIRIKINMNAVKASDLNVSSKLLRIAKLYEQ